MTIERGDKRLRTAWQRVDPITGALITGALTTACDEMAHRLLRMAYSSIIRESEDFGCALIDAAGEQIAETRLSTPLQSGPVGGYIRGILRALGERGEQVEPGDVIMHNDAYYGASHGPDVAFCVPIFVDGTLDAFSVTTAHHLDIGAATPGSCGIVDAQDSYAEGLQFKAIKVVERGRRNESVWHVIRDNIRISDIVVGDMEAQIAAARLGAERYTEIISNYGFDVVHSSILDSMDYAEARVRDKIRQLPDGMYSARGSIDGFWDLDSERYQNLEIAVNLSVSGSSISIDLQGTSPQVDRPINMPFEGTVDIACNVVIRSVLLDTVLEDAVPTNAGLYRPVSVTAPKGCLANPIYPAPVIARFCPGNVLAGTVLTALAEVVPARVSAGVGNLKIVSYSGGIGTRKPWVYMDIVEGSYGGRFGKDGMDAVDTLYANTRNNPVEDVEAHYPLQVDRYELREDGHGAGKWRGGIGCVREIRFLDEGGFSIEGDGDRVTPTGLFGGLNGAEGETVLNPNSEREERISPMSPFRRVRAGDVLRIVGPCGGGYGDPGERESEAISRDIEDGVLRDLTARTLYPQWNAGLVGE